MKNFILIFIIVLLTACDSEPVKQKITFALLVKNDTNPAYKVAYNGALAAAKHYSAIYGIEIKISHQIPKNESIQEMENLLIGLTDLAAVGLVSGISLSCYSTANMNLIINNYVQQRHGRLYTFESDIPDSYRSATYGPDNYNMGKELVKLISGKLNGNGEIAVLSGMENSYDFNERLRGIKDELQNHSGLYLPENSIYHTDETPDNSVNVLNNAISLNPNINGWIIAMPNVYLSSDPVLAGNYTAVSVLGTPNQLENIESGKLEAVLAQNCYNWGYKSIEALILETIEKIDPENKFNYDSLTVVTKDNLNIWMQNWDNWMK